MSIQQMKVLWAIFEAAELEVPSLYSILLLRQKLNLIRGQKRETHSKIEIYVRPLPELVKRVFADLQMSAEIRRVPQFSDNPKEMFESPAFAKFAPKLSGTWGQARLYRGDIMYLQGGTGKVIHFKGEQTVVYQFRNYGNQFCGDYQAEMSGPTPRFRRGPLSLRDETSGNKTKRYNKFESMFAIWPALPKKFHTSNFINFVSTSHEGDWRDVAEVVLQDLSEDSDLTLGLTVWDASTKSYILVVSALFSVMADNPRHYQICNVAGARACYNCRICYAPKGQLKAANPRNLTETLRIIDDMNATDNLAAKRRLREATGITVPVPNEDNPYLQLSNFDPHKQTTIDILHTSSLGPIKYLANSSKLIYAKKKPTLASKSLQKRVGSLFTFLSAYRGPHSIAAIIIMKHVGSMNGKDFKALAQISPFFYPWFDWENRWLWIALGAMNKLLYDTHFEHRQNRATLIQNVATAVQALVHQNFPEKAHEHTKIHLLCHLSEQFLFWGPLSMYAVEVPEHMNGDVRHCLCHGNRHCTSRDTADGLAVVEGVAELMRGGVVCGHELTELTKHKGVRRILKLDEQESRKKVFANQFVFFEDWKKIGFVKSKDEAVIVVQELVRCGVNCWGAPTYQFDAKHHDIDVLAVSGMADVLHDCWGDTLKCNWESDGKITHDSRALFVLNPFRLEEHHSCSDQEMWNIIQIALANNK
ncbi:hypothetical protein BDR26DRAFT_873841 [Obelidium mucronatum]|nr:hypothetical protein BDR26DRAFT_880660 [Obelidium mucronatum]KAI9325681.1 hypothetical protein BDR26DRAFT_878885 [Obelidium mucronatum]KAI9326209.1 hypothetical protein BDR26DRAFT_877768 [Obelidium mucronatum]KAI9328538.1 hypothetical protein BDR26DRAFT_873841 [Obelidium mucronatum]